MPEAAVVVRQVAALDAPLIDALAALTIDCVDGGASIGFMWPLSHDSARSFWLRVADAAAAGRRALLVAEDAAGLVGTVQLVIEMPANQPHRADLAKLQVHRRARRLGVGAALVRAAEQLAIAHGRTLLVLDTITGSDADRLYTRLGWQRCGEVPDYALMPRGGLAPTTFFYRRLPHSPA